MIACRWLYQIQAEEGVTWGTEAAALAAIAKSGVSVLPGFVVGREAILAYFLQSDVRKQILKACKGLGLSKAELFPAAAKEIRSIILSTPFPSTVRHELAEYLQEMEDQLMLAKGTGMPLTMVSQGLGVKHHGTTKSLADAERQLRELLALHFTEQALYHRYHEELPIIPVPFAVLAQYSPESELQGTAQQFDPVNLDGTVVYIENHGDTYRVDAKSRHLLEKSESVKHWAKQKKGKHVSPRHVHSTHHLNERQIRQVSRSVVRAQELFPEVQKFSWQLFLDAIVLSGVSPLVEETAAAAREGVSPLLVGSSIAMGHARGPVRVVKSVKEYGAIESGDVVVLSHVAEKDAHKLINAAALVFDSGHRISSEATVAHQLGVPAIVVMGNARQLLQNGQLVTVDGTHGSVYAGSRQRNELGPLPASIGPVTGTRLTALVDDAFLVTPELLAEVDGVGVLRGEFILRLLGVHPGEVLHDGMRQEYVELLVEGVERVLKAAGQKEVVYQLHDLSEHAFHGWRSWRRASHEPNQLIGYRGTHRLLAEPEILELELEALEQVMKKGYTNLELMLPMVRSLEEVKEMRKILSKLAPDLASSLWVRVETPALAISVDELVKLEPAGVIFDVAALATLITGMDHENHQVGHFHDQANQAVIDALCFAISSCRVAGIATSIVSEQEVLRAEVVEAVIQAGATEVCIRPADLPWMRGLVASVEQRMLLEHLVAD